MNLISLNKIRRINRARQMKRLYRAEQSRLDNFLKEEADLKEAIQTLMEIEEIEARRKAKVLRLI